MITQVVVDREDQAFQNPSKPVGPFLKEERAKRMEREKGWTIRQDPRGGYRRTVASPEPVKIIQSKMIQRLANVGHIVVALGGGGVPIRKSKGGDYDGVEAVVDKDLASALLAWQIKADVFLVLTDVPHAYRNFGQLFQEPLGEVTPRQVRRLIREGHFKAGSMLPKMQAALNYLAGRRGLAIITNPGNVQDALAGKVGTRIRHRPT
jgi:carbamate kinase